MYNNKLKIFAKLTIVAFITILTSCGSNKNECKEISPLFNGKDLTDNLLERYVSASSPYTINNEKTNNEVRIYVDKSSGINEAFSSPKGGKVSIDILGEIMNNYRDKAKYYGVLDIIAPFDLNGSDQSNYFRNTQNYEPVSGKGADLLLALNQISNYNGLSFFVTDAEQFDGMKQEITSGAWATKPLEKWIKSGNSIHFWITDFQVNKTSKHLFFMAFVPAQMAKNLQFLNLVKSLNTINPTHLELTNTSWKMLKPEWAEQSTGLDANLLKGGFEKENYKRNFDSSIGSYEFISIQLPIKSEVLNVQGALTKPQFYRDLFVDFSNNKFFDITKLGIDVFDVTNDFNQFSKFDEIYSNLPKTIKDPNNQATIIDPTSPYACFYELNKEKPVLKKEYEYYKDYKNSVLKELFQFDEEIFNNSLKDNNKKVELGFKLHKNFNEGDSVLNNELGYNIIRVDFKISDFNLKNVNELSNFSWDSMWKPTEKNTGFAKSIENVIKLTEPRGKVIHTLFIKFIKG